MTQDCYCGSGLPYESCCDLLISNEYTAKSPEQLMRSRYSAFATGNTKYLLKTSSQNLLEHITEEDLQETCNQFCFIKLEVIKANDSQVEFKAYMLIDNQLHCLHECSDFIKEKNEWKYDRGVLYEQPVKSLSRNDTCPCGSNKKFKKCHMQ